MDTPKDKASALELEVRDSLTEVSAQSWNALNIQDNPFLRYEFLVALEDTLCLGDVSGWYPRYFLLTDESKPDELIAAVPCFIKTNSYGEFVFDFAWAEAYEKHGLNYYPKLVAAVPFTPATGQRILTNPLHPREPLVELLASSILHYSDELKLSGVHWLFTTQEESDALCATDEPIEEPADPEEPTPELEQNASNHLQRLGCQYHWRNRSYTSFDDFLAQCTSKRRKTIKRERRHVSDANLRLERRIGNTLNEQEWQWAHQLYCATYDDKWGNPSLTLACLKQLGNTMGESVLIVFAYDDTDPTPESPVACSIMFMGGGRLYGRYWGCRLEYHSLHFEACYYQGIEHCIEYNIDVFEPGAQGEHKITRGFEPTLTYSAHHLAEPGFHLAVKRFLKNETPYMRARCEGLAAALPFKSTLELN